MYTHVDGLAGDDALQAIGTAYRRFAHANSGQFASTFLPPTSDNDDLADANRSLLNVFVLVQPDRPFTRSSK